MHHEIERKFLVKKIPRLWSVRKVTQERYFLQRGDLYEEGVKRKGSQCFHEIKLLVAHNERTREIRKVSKEDFERLKARGTQVIVRDSYELTKKSPIISIKKYKGIYYGLVLAEVEFDSVEEMEKFTPLSWMGTEVTETALGKDARLVDLDEEHFKSLLHELEERSHFSNSFEGYL